MPAKARKRSAPKQTPECQCQEQIKDILRRLEVLEATALTIKKIAVLKSVTIGDLFSHSLQLEGFLSDDSPASRFVLELPTYLDSRKRIRKKS